MTMTYIPLRMRVTAGLRLWIVGVGGLESWLMMMVTMLTAWSRDCVTTNTIQLVQEALSHITFSACPMSTLNLHIAKFLCL